MNTAAARDLAAHRSIVQERMSGEHLSKKEWEVRYHTLNDSLPGLSSEQQAMVRCQMECVREKVEELTPPDFTPEEQLQEFRDLGHHNLADNLEHSLTLDALQAELKDAQADLAAATGDDPASQRDAKHAQERIKGIQEKMSGTKNAYQVRVDQEQELKTAVRKSIEQKQKDSEDTEPDLSDEYDQLEEARLMTANAGAANE